MHAVESAVKHGSFRIDELVHFAGQVGNTLDIANATSGKLWLVADIAGWFYTGTPSATSERVRFGFLDNDPPAAGSSTITAEMQSTDCRVTSDDYGRCSQNSVATFQLGQISLTQSRTRVRWFWKSMPMQQDLDLLQGRHSPVRDAWRWKLLSKHSSGIMREADPCDSRSPVGQQFFDVDRVYITNENPIPEPASLVLFGLAAAQGSASGGVGCVEQTGDTAKNPRGFTADKLFGCIENGQF